MNDFYSILQNYYPAGEDINTHFPGIVNDRMEEVLADLPRIKSLPMPNQLEEIKVMGECPLVIEETITIAALQRHLAEATCNTPEVGITIFRNSIQALEVGTVREVFSDLPWKDFQKRGIIDFHTHPDPTKAEYMRQPSIGDIDQSIILKKPITIGSRDGLTHAPTPQVDLEDHTGPSLWRDYVEHRGFDQDSYYTYGPTKIYTEFVRDIIKPRFIAWHALNSQASLAHTILSQRG